MSTQMTAYNQKTSIQCPQLYSLIQKTQHSIFILYHYIFSIILSLVQNQEQLANRNKNYLQLLFTAKKLMKLRRTREVTQGSSNYNNLFETRNLLPSTKNLISKTGESFLRQHKISTTQPKTQVLRPSTALVYPRKNKQIFDRLFPQPRPKKINQTSSLGVNCKQGKILETLKNSCQSKNYQYFRIFNFFDEKAEGKVTPEQFQKYISCYGFEVTKKEAENLVDYFRDKSTSNNYRQRKITTQNIQQNNIQIDPSLQRLSKKQQKYFTLEDFINKVGHFTDSQQALAGQPLENKLSTQKPLRNVHNTSKRNNSVNMKKLLVNDFFEEQTSKPTKTKEILQSRPSTKEFVIKNQIRDQQRFDGQQINSFKRNIINRAQSANPLIPRSSLPFEKMRQLQINNFSFGKQSNQPRFDEKISKQLILKDQYQEKERARRKYENKLRKICGHNQDLSKKCQKQQQINQQKGRFTESWGMLSKANNWVRS